MEVGRRRRLVREFISSTRGCNRDWQFDQQDVVQILQAAKYATGPPAAWEQGDWNDDHVFDPLDIVAALQTGNYLQGPYAAGADDTATLAKRPMENETLDALFTGVRSTWLGS